MKCYRWLIGGLITLQTSITAAIAASLDYWKFDVRQNRLEIITEQAVNPKAQILANPTRFVIDLPGITLGEPTLSKAISSYIQEVRVGQFNAKTTRMVVELADNYTMRPWEIKVRSLAPNRWYVQFPKFQTPDIYTPPPEAVAIAVPPPQPYPQTRYVVVIDPGHGGKDPGAIGIGGIQEKWIVVDIASEVAKILRKQGIGVIMTRSNDTYVSLKGRVQRAENANATIFVSIHANSVGLGQSQVNGVETYYYGSTAGFRLAQTIQRSILRRIRVSDRGVRSARFYVIRKTTMPAALVEVGFVTGNVDSGNLTNASYRRRMAEAIAQGILDYL